MRTIPKIAKLVLAASLVLPATVLAKRIPAPVVEPIVHEGIRYTVPNDKGTVGYVVASDAATGKELWKKIISENASAPARANGGYQGPQVKSGALMTGV